VHEHVSVLAVKRSERNGGFNVATTQAPGARAQRRRRDRRCGTAARPRASHLIGRVGADAAFIANWIAARALLAAA